jgi:mannose-6-phosphate isomerase-like protein (cupin superfamily)
MQKRQTIGNNASGEALTMLVSEDENGGACQLYEVHLPPYRPTPPLHYHVDFTETFTVKTGQLDIYIGTEQRRLLLCAGDSVTAKLRQPHRFANDHDEAVTFTVETKPAGGVVKAFQMAYGIANDGGAAPDGLPKNPRCPTSVRKDRARLLARYPTHLANAGFRLRAVRRQNHRPGEKVAGLLFLSSVVV